MIEADDLRKIMRDKKRASLGDAYINLAYSLSLTRVGGEPKGVKVSDRILANAFKEAGLRKFLGTRLSRKDFADASEAILTEAFQARILTMEESVNVISQDSNPVSGIANLLKLAVERLTQT
jgi:hypothetical protein